MHNGLSIYQNKYPKTKVSPTSPILHYIQSSSSG